MPRDSQAQLRPRAASNIDTKKSPKNFNKNNEKIASAILTRNSNISAEYQGINTRNGFASSVYDLESYRERNSAASNAFTNSDLKKTINIMKNGKTRS